MRLVMFGGKNPGKEGGGRLVRSTNGAVWVQSCLSLAGDKGPME